MYSRALCLGSTILTVSEFTFPIFHSLWWSACLDSRRLRLCRLKMAGCWIDQTFLVSVTLSDSRPSVCQEVRDSYWNRLLLIQFIFWIHFSNKSLTMRLFLVNWIKQTTTLFTRAQRKIDFKDKVLLLSITGKSKTLMFFDGCASHLGCTVTLRGGPLQELKKVWVL